MARTRHIRDTPGTLFGRRIILPMCYQRAPYGPIACLLASLFGGMHVCCISTTFDTSSKRSICVLNVRIAFLLACLLQGHCIFKLT